MKWNLQHVSSLYARARAVPRTAPAPVAVTIPSEIVAEAPAAEVEPVVIDEVESEEEHGESN